MVAELLLFISFCVSAGNLACFASLPLALCSRRTLRRSTLSAWAVGALAGEIGFPLLPDIPEMDTVPAAWILGAVALSTVLLWMLYILVSQGIGKKCSSQ